MLDNVPVIVTTGVLTVSLIGLMWWLFRFVIAAFTKTGRAGSCSEIDEIARRIGQVKAENKVLYAQRDRGIPGAELTIRHNLAVIARVSEQMNPHIRRLRLTETGKQCLKERNIMVE